MDPFFSEKVGPQSVDAEDAARCTGGGRTLFAWSRHDVTLRFVLPFSRKMRPISMFRQPMENRKNAETRAKSSTWWERMAAPILRGVTLSAGKRRERTGREGTYRHCITPSGPKPKSEPRTGKNRLKNAIGHPISEKMRAMTWKVIKSRLRMAQNSPAGSLGTVL
jgi:hypothetical protein